jgi:glycosyltransferase involved in cell wall biosynthesis
VKPERVAFTPWCYTLSDDELRTPVGDGGFVFAGGDSMRDYRPFLAACEGLDAPVRIAAKQSLSSEGQELPANVDVRPVTHREFVEETGMARIVVVPLAATTDRSAGQGTYLNAMALGKAVIVTDVMGARDYIDPGVTGLLVPPGDAEAMRESLRWALSPENGDAVRRMGARASAVVRARFGPNAYIEALLRVVDAARC